MTTILPPRKADDDTIRYVGLDLAKKETQVAVLNSDGKQIASRRFQATAGNYRQLASELGPNDCVALEVSTNSFNVARILMTSTARVRISDPVKTKVIASAKVKTDKIDARVLAELDRADYLPTVWLPDPYTDRLRHLMSNRQSLVDRRTELKNRVHGILHREIISTIGSDLFGRSGSLQLDSIAATDELDCWDQAELESARGEIAEKDLRIAEMEKAIAAYLCSNQAAVQMVDLLLSISGVSLVVAAGLVAAIGDVSRFTKGKQLASYFGLVPSTYQSGDSSGYHGRITKRGRAQARWLLIEAAEHARKSGPMRAFYLRIAKKRNHNVAVVAVARKLAEIIFRLLSKQEDYLYSIPRLTDEKRARLRMLASQTCSSSDSSPGNALRRPSGPPDGSPRSPLYGSGLRGRKIKSDIVRKASTYAEAAYRTMVQARAAGKRLDAPIGFDPTRPSAIDWQAVLEKAAIAIANKQSSPSHPERSLSAPTAKAKLPGREVR